MGRLLQSLLLVILLCVYGTGNAQNICEMLKLTEEDWLDMSTEKRLTAIGMANKHAQNQTFIGDFGKFYDIHKNWGL